MGLLENTKNTLIVREIIVPPERPRTTLDDFINFGGQRDHELKLGKLLLEMNILTFVR
jgi:hypothetical protein